MTHRQILEEAFEKCGITFKEGRPPNQPDRLWLIHEFGEGYMASELALIFDAETEEFLSVRGPDAR